MERQIAIGALASKWAVVAAIAVTYDYFLTLNTEIQYVWSRKMTSAGAIYVVIRCSSLVTIILGFLDCFPWPGKSSPYAAIKTRSTYDPGPHNMLTLCNADFSHFEFFREGNAQQGLRITAAFFQNGVAYFAALLVGNIINLAFINDVQLLFNLIGALTAMTVVLTCRFILDLFEASARARFGTVPTLHLSAMVRSRSLAFAHVGGVSATGASAGIFGADVSWGSTEESESDWSKKDECGFELQPMNPERQTPDVHAFRSDS
ncbi:uncharacterized protein BXZ73DRAFT_98058 [Epithele typhae]|uniref:uncharacterized protein n=1 Tax=Epithele typhae TaxID=378194 RepID=UPI00200860BC|nr:uncharacterized protein BXZ73DRAFT_98058 [Epithele typhae]KAH9941671.1 hypothetical protein BXZ73DRAFT_98058 [Epithele typhae]